ncbi:Protein MM3350-like domain containing protein [Elaphomyces granulatus]
MEATTQTTTTSTVTCAVCRKTKISELSKCGRCSSRFYCSTKCQKADWRTHKTECRRQNYILKIDLLPGYIINPRITRTLSCPATVTFAALHEALLVAFGWANTHLYDFEVFGHSETTGRSHRLSGPEPLFKLTDLDTIEDDFDIGIPTPPNRDSSKVRLFKVLDDPKTKGNTIHYNYDFGDGWEHVITCIGRTPATPHFVCLDGEGHGCAEDVGGPSGWEELLKAYDAETPTKDQKMTMKWFETFASNKDPRGLRGDLKWQWDKDGVNAALRGL